MLSIHVMGEKTPTPTVLEEAPVQELCDGCGGGGGVILSHTQSCIRVEKPDHCVPARHRRLCSVWLLSFH